MTKQNTKNNFDFTKMMGDMNMGDFKMPNFSMPNMDDILETQRRNVEAMTKANKMAFDGAQAVLARQNELTRQAMEDLTTNAKNLGTKQDPSENLSAQTDATKETLERSLSNMRELTEMLTKSNNEVFSLLSNRVTQVLDEYKSMVEKAADEAKATNK